MYKPGQFVSIAGKRYRAAKIKRASVCYNCFKNNRKLFYDCMKRQPRIDDECFDKLGSYMYPAIIKQPK